MASIRSPTPLCQLPVMPLPPHIHRLTDMALLRHRPRLLMRHMGHLAHTPLLKLHIHLSIPPQQTHTPPPPHIRLLHRGTPQPPTATTPLPTQRPLPPMEGTHPHQPSTAHHHPHLPSMVRNPRLLSMVHSLSTHDVMCRKSPLQWQPLPLPSLNKASTPQGTHLPHTKQSRKDMDAFLFLECKRQDFAESLRMQEWALVFGVV
mmetsp:Transcript_4028/g.6202  ORF Transcript_4028/g.6202 Transcript_4028/m.6202 type:complete len:204 (+) Transcript_4028:667-1278(+)